MANIILFSHGQLATGLADSCKLIIGENHFKVLNILFICHKILSDTNIFKILQKSIDILIIFLR